MPRAAILNRKRGQKHKPEEYWGQDSATGRSRLPKKKPAKRVTGITVRSTGHIRRAG